MSIKMTVEEILENVNVFFQNGVFNEEFLEAIPDIHIVLNKFYDFDNYIQKELIYILKPGDVFKYINENEHPNESLIKCISQYYDVVMLDNAMQSIDSDYTRAKILILGGDGIFLPYIENQYYRNQIVKAKSEFSFEQSDLLAEIEEYNTHKKNIEQFNDEKSKAYYISNINDRDMKQSFLVELKDKENRDIVIKSFNRNVDSKIANLDQLAQIMIRDFFEDTLKEKFTDDKRERLEIVFNRSDISFDNLEPNVNGKANYIFRN